MSLSTSLLVLALAVTAGCCTVAAALLFTKFVRRGTGDWFFLSNFTQFLVLLFIAAWATGQLVTVTVDSVTWKLAGVYVGGLATFWSASTWLFFAFSYTGRDDWITRRTVALLLVVPVFATVGIATDFLHGSFVVDPALVSDGQETTFVFEWGPGTWAVAIYSWVLSTGTIWLLFKKFLTSRNIYRKIAFLNIVGGIALNVGAFFDVVGIGLGYFVTGPIAFSIIAVLSALALVSHRYLRMFPLDRLLSVFSSRFRSLTPMGRDVIIQNMRSGVLVLDYGNRIVDLNPMGRRLLDAVDERVVGLRLTDVVDPDIFQTENTAFLDPDTTDGHFSAVCIETPSGEHRWMDIVISPLDPTDETAGRAALITDVTERERRKQMLKRRTEELARQNDQLEQFAGIVSHDLRNPLTVAKGHLENAAVTDESQALEEIEYSLNRMEAIIDDVLLLARQGQSIGETEPVSLESVARRAWDHVETAAAELVIIDDLEITGDPERLLHLFENCYRNAVQHAGPGVTVTVGGDTDCFYIVDDGPGIPPADRDAVMESGFTTHEAGTGFGLAIVTQVANAHGWEVDVTESAAGGARFEFHGIDRSRPAAVS